MPNRLRHVVLLAVAVCQLPATFAALDPNDPNDPNSPAGPSIITVGPPSRLAGSMFDRWSFELGINQIDPFLTWAGDGFIDVAVKGAATSILAETQLVAPSGPKIPPELQFTTFATSLGCYPNVDPAPGCGVVIATPTLNDLQLGATWADSEAPYAGSQQFTFFRLVLGRTPGLPPLTLTQTPYFVAQVDVTATIVNRPPETRTIGIYALSLCVGDLDSDLDVDLSDLAIVLANFGLANAAPEDGDTNGDGSVTLEDLAVVLAAYGQDC